MSATKKKTTKKRRTKKKAAKRRPKKTYATVARSDLKVGMIVKSPKWIQVEDESGYRELPDGSLDRKGGVQYHRESLAKATGVRRPPRLLVVREWDAFEGETELASSTGDFVIDYNILDYPPTFQVLQ